MRGGGRHLAGVLPGQVEEVPSRKRMVRLGCGACGRRLVCRKREERTVEANFRRGPPPSPLPRAPNLRDAGAPRDRAVLWDALLRAAVPLARPPRGRRQRRSPAILLLHDAAERRRLGVRVWPVAAEHPARRPGERRRVAAGALPPFKGVDRAGAGRR